MGGWVGGWFCDVLCVFLGIVRSIFETSRRLLKIFSMIIPTFSFYHRLVHWRGIRLVSHVFPLGPSSLGLFSTE